MSDVLRILVAPLAWLASFSAIYGLHGLGCALRWPEVEISALSLSLFRAVLLGALLTALLLQLGLLQALRSRRFGAGSSFVRRTSVATGWTGLAATLWTLHPVAVTSSCG